MRLRWSLGPLLLLTTTCGPPGPVLGAPCDHGGDLPVDGRRFTAGGCGGDVCAYADNAAATADICVSDAACNLTDPTAQKFECKDGRCALTGAWTRERSMCSFGCDFDDDCTYIDDDTRCASGFVCAAMPEFCCNPLCLCADDVSNADIATATQACDAGQMQCAGP